MRKYVFSYIVNKFLCSFKVVTNIFFKLTLQTLNVLDYSDCCNTYCYLMRKSDVKTQMISECLFLFFIKKAAIGSKSLFTTNQNTKKSCKKSLTGR